MTFSVTVFALNWALKKSAQRYHLEQESCTENEDTNCSWKAFISKYLSVSAKLQKSWPRAAGTLSAAASKKEPECLTYKPPTPINHSIMGCANEGELREKQEYFVLPPVPTSFTTCIFTTCASLTISVIFLNYTLMKYTQSQSGICKANRLCAAQGLRRTSSAHAIQTQNQAFPGAPPLLQHSKVFKLNHCIIWW